MHASTFFKMQAEFLNSKCQLELWEEHWASISSWEVAVLQLGAVVEAAWMSATDFNRRGIEAVCYNHFLKGKLTTYWKSGYERHKLLLFLPGTVQFMSLHLFKSDFHCVAFLVFPLPQLIPRHSERAGGGWAVSTAGKSSNPCKKIKFWIMYVLKV